MCACAEDCKIYSEDCGGGLEGGYVRALIKNLVCKNKKAKAIRFGANGHHESDHQTRKDKCRVQRLLHVQINNSRPTAGTEENSLCNPVFVLLITQTRAWFGVWSVFIQILSTSCESWRATTVSDSLGASSDRLAWLQRAALQWDAHGRRAARLRASETQ